MASPGWPCVAWPEELVCSWLHHGGRAMPAVPRQLCAGVAAQLVASSPQPCSVQAGTTAKANRSPRGPGGGSRSVLCRPLGLSWPPALLSPRRLAAASRSSVLPHGPWPQIRRGAGLAAAPVGEGCQAGRKRLQGGSAERTRCPLPAAPEGGKLAAWPGLVATRVQHYDTWLRGRRGPDGSGGPVGNQPPPRGSRPQRLSQGSAGPAPHQGDGAGSDPGAWGRGGTVSDGDGARGGSCCPGEGTGLCRWQQRAVPRGPAAAGQPRPRCPVCRGRELPAACAGSARGVAGRSGARGGSGRWP